MRHIQEIEVTPEMIEAGAKALTESLEPNGDSASDIVAMKTCTARATSELAQAPG